MRAERRATNRCTVYFDEIQVSVYPSQKIYPIKDIGKGGLAIEYCPVADEPIESESVDIMALEKDRFYLPNIACETVCDIQTLMYGRSFRGGDE